MALDGVEGQQAGKPPGSAGGGGAGSAAAPGEASQAPAARTIEADSTQNLMEAVVERQNLFAAYERVVGNKGCAGIDGMEVEELKPYLQAYWPSVREQLLAGTYQPKPVLRKAIPKPDGGTRNLGIPTVLDRLIQQALLQVLAPIFQPTFSRSSYAYQEGRSAHDAVRAARRYVEEGFEWLVDIDVEKFFDRVNHDILMRLLAEQVKDKRVLKLIGRYLRAGVMVEGVVLSTAEGTPQGGPLSPLLSNVMLDVLDKELERRGLRFCRYADDCNIYVRSKKAAQRVLESVKRFLGKKLKLKVNDKKSAAAKAHERRFLGFTITAQTRIAMAATTVVKLHQKVVEKTARNEGRALKQVIKELNQYLLGWIGYFALADAVEPMASLDGWIRRRLRCAWWVQRKTRQKRQKALVKLGVSREAARHVAGSTRGPWRLSSTQQLHQALNNRFFIEQGLVSLAREWEKTRQKWQLTGAR